jgi:hypothetical protein
LQIALHAVGNLTTWTIAILNSLLTAGVGAAIKASVLLSAKLLVHAAFNRTAGAALSLSIKPSPGASIELTTTVTSLAIRANATVSTYADIVVANLHVTACSGVTVD